MLYDNLRDILRHTQELGFLESAKIIGKSDSVDIHAITPEKTVVLFGKLNNTIPSLADNTVGFSRLAVLKGYVNFPAFAADDATIEIRTQERQSKEVPSEINFKSPLGHDAHYRFMSEEMANKQITMPTFKGATWDVEYIPTKKNIQDLMYFNGVLGGFEPTFNVDIEGSELRLSIGSGPTDRSIVPFGKINSGNINKSWRWPLSEVLSILKLSSADECTMYMSDQGALKLTMNSGLGVYDYIIPARS